MKRRAVVLSPLLPMVGSALFATGAAARTLNGFDLRGALVPVEAIEQGGPQCMRRRTAQPQPLHSRQPG